MFTDTVDGQQLTQELSKQLLLELAPEELEVFDELYSEFRANPVPSGEKSGSDDALGFGQNELMVVFTPAVCAAISGVITYLSSEVIKAAKDESSSLIKEKIKSIFSSGKEKDALPPLSKETFAQIKKVAEKNARARGLPAKKAEQLALAIVGSLALKAG